MEYILYSLGILLLYEFFGFGLTFLLCPKNLEKYTLFFAPFVGLTYVSCLGTYFADFSTFGSNVYASWLLFPSVIFFGIAFYFKKDQLSELTWPFQKENIPLIIVCIIIFLAISIPYLIRFNGDLSNTITLGCGDIVNDAAMSKFLTQFSFVHPPINIDSSFVMTIQRGANHIAADFSTAIPSSIFSIEPYKIQNLVLYLFYVFLLPIVFLIGIEIFKFKKYMALIITLLTGLSFHLIYINYQGFLGEVIGIGIFLSLFLVTIYSLLNCNKFTSYLPYILLTTILTFGLIVSYSPLLPLYYIPLSLFLLLVFISTKSIYRLLSALSFLLLTLVFAFLLSPFEVIKIIKDIFLFTSDFGWNMPIVTPAWGFGFAQNSITNWGFGFAQNGLGMQYIGIQSSPIFEGVLSALIVLVVIISFYHLFKTERCLFYLSISYISFFLGLYFYLTFQEVFLLSSSGDSYKAYKLFTYFIPIILLAGLSCFRNFEIIPLKKVSKTQIVGIFFLILLILANIYSASAIIKANYDNGIAIKENILGLQKITKMNNVSSINIGIPQWLDQMWAYYFIFSDKKIYLEYTTYYQAGPPLGEWTLQGVNNPKSNSLNLTNSSNIIEINNDYFLVKNNLSKVNNLSSNWFDLESDQ